LAICYPFTAAMDCSISINKTSRTF